MIRWKGIAVFGGIILLFFVLSFFFTDQWLEEKLEDAGSAVVGARVDIEGLDLELFDLYLGLDHLQITNPKNTMRNIVETGPIKIDFEFWPLLSGKVIVDEIAIEDMESDTPRKTDGRIEKNLAESTGEIAQATSSYVKEQSKKYVAPKLGEIGQSVNTDSILSRMKMTSVPKMESLQKEMEGKYKKWDDRFKNLKIEDDVNTIKTESKKIDLKKLDNLVKLKTSLEAVGKIRKSLNRINDNYNAVKKDFDTDYKFATTNWDSVNQWISEDYKKAMALANIPDFSVGNIGRIIFGNEMMGQYETYLGYIKMARGYLAPSEEAPPKEEKPKRFKGQDIRFVKRTAEPDWWIKKINLSGFWNDIKITGNITDMVSNQKQINKNTVIKINGKGQNGGALVINGVLDYLGEKPHEEFHVDYNGFSLNNKTLSKSKYLPGKVEKGTGYIRTVTDIKDSAIVGSIRFDANQLTLKTGGDTKSADRYSKLISDALADIHAINVNVKITGSDDNLKFDLNSNIDRLVRDAIKKTLSKEVEKAKAEIKKRIDKETGKYRAQLEENTKKYEKELRAKLSKYEDQIKAQTKVVDDKKKEIEKAIAKQTGNVGKKIKDILKF